MTNENVYRIIFTVIFFTAFAISAYYRRRARMQVPQIARKQESGLLKFGRVLLAVPLYGAMFLYVIHPAWMQWAAWPLPAWLRWVGVGMGLAVLPLLHWLFRHLGKNISETVLTKAAQELVVSGPYRWIRHPLYTVAIVGLFALSLIAANAFMTVMILLIAVLLPALTTQEEKHLLEKFGERYRAYMKRTGRFLPRLQFLKP